MKSETETLQPTKDPSLEAAPAFTPGPYERDGCTVYKLEGTGRYSGKGSDYKEDLANRFTAHVQGNRCSEAEKEAIASLFAAAPAMYEALKHFAELGRDLTHLFCHTKICRPEQCSRCSHVVAARAALSLADGQQQRGRA